MSVRVWRLSASAWASTMFSGEGAAKAGQRWNPPGVRMVYCSDHIALAALESMVHLDDVSQLQYYVYAAITVDPSALQELDSGLTARLKRGDLLDLSETQDAGKRMFESGALGFRAPSFVLSAAYNVMLNPAHPDFASLLQDAPVQFPLDPRLHAYKKT